MLKLGVYTVKLGVSGSEIGDLSDENVTPRGEINDLNDEICFLIGINSF